MDMCVAVLAFKNPNVYYELAIAQAANKPVIILKHCDEVIPFDVKDYKYIEYDLEDTEKIKEDVYIKKVIDFLKSIKASNWKTSDTIPGFNLIDTDLQYFEKSFEELEVGEYILYDAKKIFYMMSIVLSGWFTIGKEKLSEVLLEKAKKDCQIKILMMHKDNPALSDLINDDISNISGIKYYELLEKTWESYSKIAEKHKNIEVRRLKSGTMTHIKYINDSYGFYVPRFYSTTIPLTPLWKCKQGTYLYEILLKDFELLWKLSE